MILPRQISARLKNTKGSARNKTSSIWFGVTKQQRCSGFAERNSDTFPDPARWRQLLCECAVEGVQTHLSLVVGDRSGLVVQQHSDAQRPRVQLQLTCDGLLASGMPSAQLMFVKLQAPRQLVHAHHAAFALLFAWDVGVRHAHVGPRFGHLQLPVMLTFLEALETQHLPRVIEARLVGGDRAWPGGEVLRPTVTTGKTQVSVGGARVKGQAATVFE